MSNRSTIPSAAPSAEQRTTLTSMPRCVRALAMTSSITRPQPTTATRKGAGLTLSAELGVMFCRVSVTSIALFVLWAKIAKFTLI